jgi:uncharacterized coiled-coil DUF342 family protein
MSGTDDPTHVYWDLENRKGLWARGEAMRPEEYEGEMMDYIKERNAAEKAEAELRRAVKFWRAAQERAEKMEAERDEARSDWVALVDEAASTEAERDALRAEVERLRKRISDEWLSLTAALGDHAHPGLSPSENVVELHERLTEARWEVKGLEAERDALRLDFAAFRATALETSNHLHDVIRERDALRERLEIEPVDLDMVEELRTLRAEVSKMRTATAQAAIRSARRVFAPTDEIGDARAEAADHAAVARGRLDTIAEVEARAERAETALRTLLDKMERVEATEAYRSVWIVAQIHAGPYHGETWAVERNAARAALRDTAPRREEE